MMKVRLNSGQKFAILLLVASGLAQYATTPTNGQTVRQTNGGSTKQQQPKQTNLSPPTTDQQQQVAAPFYSIKDGKTSARRIQQQQQLVASNRQPTTIGGQSVVANQFEQNQSPQQVANGRADDNNMPTADNVSPDNQSMVANDNFAPSSIAMMQNSGAIRPSNDDRQQQQQTTSDAVEQVISSQLGSGQSVAAGDGESTMSMGNDLQQQQPANVMNENTFQQQMAINSFSQLIGNAALDDFGASSTPTTLAPNKNNEMAPTSEMSANDQQRQSDAGSITTSSSSLSNLGATDSSSASSSSSMNGNNGNLNNQRQPVTQFTTATGAPLSSTPSSLSMSLDGMIVNSRPRASSGQSGLESTKSTGSNRNNKKHQQKVVMGNNGGSAVPVSRIGEAAPNGSSQNRPEIMRGAPIGQVDAQVSPQQQQQNGFNSVAAKAPRRVPFSGIPFSSPATKGQRTKPKASNQIGSFGQLNNNNNQQQQLVLNNMNSIFGPQAAEMMAALQLDSRPLITGPNSNQNINQNMNEAQFFRQQQQQQQPGGMGQSINQMKQMLNDAANSGAMMQQQIDAQLSQGFDEDQQMRLNVPSFNAGSNNESPAAGNSNGLDMMQNPMQVNSGLSPSAMRTNQLPSGSPSMGANGINDDMVMSVMSSADGKDRRLVMISRDTLDNLQRFAAQQQQNLPGGGGRPQTLLAATKSKTTTASQRGQNRPMMIMLNNGSPDQSSLVSSNGSLSSPTNNRWPSGQTMWAPSLSSAGQVQLQQQILTTMSPNQRDSQSGQQQQQQRPLDQQQEVLLQTTTSAPLSMFTGTGNGGVTTATTLTTTTTQQPLSTTTGGAQESTDTTNSTMTTTTTTTMRGATSDSFREVPVSTLLDGSTVSSGDSQQQRQDGSGNGSGQQVAALSGVKSKTSDGKSLTNSQQQAASAGGKSGGSTKQQSQRNGGSSSSSVKTNGKKKNNGPSKASNGKQASSSSSSSALNSNSSNGNKQQAKSSSKAGTKSGSGKKKASTTTSNQGGKKQSVVTSGIRVTNGQQQPAAMMSRVFDREQSIESGLGRKVNATSAGGAAAGGDELSTTTQTSSGIQTSSNNQEDQVGGQQQPVQMTTTTSSSMQANGKRPSLSSATTQTTTNFGSSGTMKGDEEQQQPPSSGGGSFSGAGRGSTTGSRLMSVDVDLEKQLDELERGVAIGSSSSGPSVGGSSSSVGQVQSSSSSSGSNVAQSDAERLDSLRAAIPGEPQTDYPIYSSPPKTSFDCMSQSCPGGYYADMETQCQVFHICQSDGRFDTFLCPNGTIFSQQHFVCVWWWQVDCQQSATFYKLNDNIYCNSMFPASPSSSPNTSPPLTPTTTGGAQTGNSLPRFNGTTVMNNNSRAPFDGSGNDLSESTPTVPSMRGGSDNTGSGNGQVSTTSSSSSVTSDTSDDRAQLNGGDSSLTNTNMKQQQQTGDADLNQQQQQQLELLSRRA